MTTKLQIDQVNVTSVALLASANTFTASNNNFQGTAANDLPTYSAEFLDAANWTLGAGNRKLPGHQTISRSIPVYRIAGEVGET